jgi:hypothetical protein
MIGRRSSNQFIGFIHKFLYSAIFRPGPVLLQPCCIRAAPRTPVLFRFQNPNNRLTPIGNGHAGWWCIRATLRAIRNSMVHFNCGLRPTIVNPKGAVWSQPLKEAGDETSVEP